MQYMQERGCLAITPGQALDDVVSALSIQVSQVQSFKSWTVIPTALEDFSHDARFLDCIGTKYSVQDIWTKRFEA